MTDPPHDPTGDAPANHAIARLAAGMAEAGVSLVTNHPGFRSNELARAVHGPSVVTSANERTAFAVAWGHAIGGRRAAVTLKNVGLNDAADPFLNSLALDVNAGLVVVVFDDTDMEHSQLRLDSRHYRAFLGGAWLEPANLGEAARFAREAFELSEHWSQPVVLRVTNALLGRAAAGAPRAAVPRATPAHPFVRKPERLVVHPANHAAQQAALAEKTRAVQAWADGWCRELNPGFAPAGGEVHLVAGSARAPSGVPGSAVLKVPCLPPPAGLLAAALAGGAGAHVYEHGDPVVAGLLSGILAGTAVHPHVCGSLGPNRSYHCRDHLAPLFAELRSGGPSAIIGDLGGFTMDPARSVDACLCYGASVGTAAGFALAQPGMEVFCVCGDGAFIHSAKEAVAEAVVRDASLLVIVLDNGGCRGTGGQMPAGDTWLGHPRVTEERAAFDPAAQADCLTVVRRLRSLPGVRLLHLATPF